MRLRLYDGAINLLATKLASNKSTAIFARPEQPLCPALQHGRIEVRCLPVTVVRAENLLGQARNWALANRVDDGRCRAGAGPLSSTADTRAMGPDGQPVGAANEIAAGAAPCES